MAAVKLLSVSTFTIFLTLLLLSSRIYCQNGEDEEDCEEDDDSGSGHGPGPGGNGPGPGGKRTEPGGKGTEPGGKGTEPGGKGPGPGGKGLGPEGKGLGPGGKGLGPGGKGLGPGGKGLGPGGKGPGGSPGSFLNLIDPKFLKEVSDSLKQINDIGKQMTSIINDGKDGLDGDSTSELQSLFQKMLKPVGDLLQTVVDGYVSINIAALSKFFDALPPQISEPLRGPVEDVFNNMYDIAYGITGIIQSQANGDQAGVTKNEKDTIDGVNGLNQSLIALFGVFPDLLSSGAD